MAARRNERRVTWRARSKCMRLLCASATGVVALLAAAPMAGAQTHDNPAHAIAEQFAGASQPDRVAADRTSPGPLSNRQSAAQARAQDEQRAYEEELLERARAEAEARLKADIAAEQEAARARAETNAAAKAESERQARQRAEAEQKARDAAKALAEAKARAEQDMKAEAARRAAEAEEAQQRAAAEQLAGQREQEAKALSERLRAARRARADERARALAEAKAKSEAEAKAQALAAEQARVAAEAKALAENEAKTKAAALERARQRLSQHAGKLEEKIEQNRRARIAAETPARPHEQVGTSAIATGSTHPARDRVAQERADEPADRAGSGVANARDADHAGVEIADSHDGGQQFYLEDRGVAGEDPGGDRDAGRAADERSGGNRNDNGRRSGDDIGERNAAGERSATGTSAARGNSGVSGDRDNARQRNESGSESSRSNGAAEHEDRSSTRAGTPAGYIPLARPERATVLLVMTPGRRGIRRWNKTADPMLCIEGSCYISAGDQSPARQISRRKGFGPGIALGERAGACRNQTACVFRDVDMAGGKVWMQPIDLRILRHDRRESRRVEIDRSCSIVRGRLSCRQTVESDDYRAWIVPEDVAAAAGEQALRDALAAGLSTNVSHLSGR